MTGGTSMDKKSGNMDKKAAKKDGKKKSEK